MLCADGFAELVVLFCSEEFLDLANSSEKKPAVAEVPGRGAAADDDEDDEENEEDE